MSNRSCSDCGKGITPRAKSGFCRKCIWKRQIADPEFQRRRVEASRGPGFRPGRKCSGCEADLNPRNRTGLCLTCFNKNPEHSAKRAAGVSAYRVRMMQDPDFAERARQHGRWLGKSGTGNAAAPAGSEPRRRAAQTASDRRLAWCPAAYRPFYRKQLRRFRFAAPARRETLARIEADRIAKLTTFDNIEMAADHLRRFAPVFKREGGYHYGTVTLTPEELVGRALLRGWQPPFSEPVKGGLIIVSIMP